MLFAAEPQKTRVMFPLLIPARSPRLISSAVSSSPSKYFMISSSSPSAEASMSCMRAVSTSSAICAGTSLTSAFSPM